MKRTILLSLIVAALAAMLPGRGLTQQPDAAMAAAARLDAALREASIPIEGIALINATTNPPTIRVDYKASATQAQRDQGAAIVAAHDWRRRRARSLAALTTSINNLSAADRQKLQVAVAAEFLQRNPQFAKKLNINVEGDELDQ